MLLQLAIVRLIFLEVVRSRWLFLVISELHKADLLDEASPRLVTDHA